MPNGDEAVWALADMFRNETQPGWRPRSFSFEGETRVVPAAGGRWDIDCSVNASGGRNAEFEISVLITQRGNHPSRGLPAPRRLRLFQFLEDAERKMWRLHYGGSFDIDRHDGVCQGHFNKFVRTAAALRRELRILAALRLGEDARSRNR